MHPAHQAFREWLLEKPIARLGQLCIRVGDNYELLHVEDQTTPASKLATYRDPFAARDLALRTDGGKFRPLKSAPNLRRGWRIDGLDFVGLMTAIDCFYPAAIAHWHSARTGRLEVTSYRACTARQTGMYRITTKLADDQVQRVAACCCADNECLKQIAWDVSETSKLALAKTADGDAAGLPILCPEPCSLFLSFARKTVRLEQEEIMDEKFTKSEIELIGCVLKSVLNNAHAEYREGDYDDPRHRQRIQYFLKKHERTAASSQGGTEQTGE